MDIHDYLIPADGKDWEELTTDWSWLLPEEFAIWLVNRLGDLVIELPDGSVHFLDLGAGSLERIADDREQFAKLIESEDNANNWLALSIVDDCLEAGVTLEANECYGFRQLPALGGEYSVENLVPVDLAVQLSIAGQIHRQIHDLEDGTEIQIELE